MDSLVSSLGPGYDVLDFISFRPPDQSLVFFTYGRLNWHSAPLCPGETAVTRSRYSQTSDHTLDSSSSRNEILVIAVNFPPFDMSKSTKFVPIDMSKGTKFVLIDMSKGTNFVLIDMSKGTKFVLIGMSKGTKFVLIDMLIGT